MRQVNSLQAALDEEHNNFTRVSKVLNQERKLATLARSQQDSVIKVREDKVSLSLSSNCPSYHQILYIAVYFYIHHF